MMKAWLQQRSEVVGAGLLWGMRVFFSLAAVGAAFLLWMGSPSTFHGHVVARAVGWSRSAGRLADVLVIVFAGALWFARLKPVGRTRVRGADRQAG